jgi:hypothetical protein
MDNSPGTLVDAYSGCHAIRERPCCGKALYAYNVAATGVDDRRPIGCVATDPATGEVIGSLWARTEMGLLFLTMFSSRSPYGAAESAAA